jgi:D-serine deaminase-like pyridoxal phosphate-dependent protein
MTEEGETYNYYKKIIKNLSLPSLFCDINLLDENIKIIQKLTKKKIRLATKSIRSLEIIKYILNKSDQFQGLMCYSGEEAKYLFENNLDNILLGYPIVDRNIIQDLIKMKKKIIFMVDLIDHLKLLEEIGKETETVIEICIDIDLSSIFLFGAVTFGVMRSNCNSLEKLDSLYQFIKKSKYLKVNGIMGYEAQIAGISDINPNNYYIFNMILRILKYFSKSLILSFRKDCVEYLVKNGENLEIINGGGSGSVLFSDTDECINEITVGSAFLSGHLFDYYNDVKFKPACFYAIPITRNPSKGVYTCQGGGYVASGSFSKDKMPIIHLPKNVSFRSDEGFGEVQTPIFTTLELKIADPIFLRHGKSGEIMEHFNEIILIGDGEILKKIKTYRGDGKCFK